MKDKIFVGSGFAKIKGFTLVEMLVSVAVLVVLVTLLAQLLGSATSVTTSSSGRLDSDDQARLVLDRLGADFKGILAQPDADFRVIKENGNDEIYFFSEVPGIADASASANTLSGISLIGYRVEDEVLERYAKALNWDQVKFLTYDESGNIDASSGFQNPPTDLPEFSTHFHVLAEGVFRFEVGFLLTDGSFSQFPVRDGGGPVAGSSKWDGKRGVIQVANTDTPIFKASGWTDVHAVVVTIAILDPKSRVILDAGELEGISNAFDDAQNSLSARELPSAAWTKAVNNGLNLPKRASGAVRIYQRAFYINTL